MNPTKIKSCSSTSSTESPLSTKTAASWSPVHLNNDRIHAWILQFVVLRPHVGHFWYFLLLQRMKILTSCCLSMKWLQVCTQQIRRENSRAFRDFWAVRTSKSSQCSPKLAEPDFFNHCRNPRGELYVHFTKQWIKEESGSLCTSEGVNARSAWGLAACACREQLIFTLNAFIR